MSSKTMRCVALVAAIFVVAASPAAAQDPDPVPAPPLPAPDPAPPAPPKPAPTRPRPAPVKKPAARPAPAPARVAPTVIPEVVAPAAQPQPRRSAPVRAKRAARTKHVLVTKPAEPLRRLPIRDASTPRIGETALVLTAAQVGEGDGSVGAIVLVAAFWLALAVALLVVASVAPFAEVPQPLGVFLYERRSVLALIGVNMLAAAAICYLVVAAA
jgi:hypothetical protein